MGIEIKGVTIDCADPAKLADFWTAALDYEIGNDIHGVFLFLVPRGSDPARADYVALQKVGEPKSGKNRLHLDFHTTDRPAEVERLVDLGATAVSEHTAGGMTWTVLTDPEGNEFCVGSHTT